eukprot:7306283-Prorocentrum_lima.AAC.1
MTCEERSFPGGHPGCLMKKMHKLDTTGDMKWNRFYHGLQTTETTMCPLDEVIVIDHVKVNAVRNKKKYWIEPSRLAADPEQPS